MENQKGIRTSPYALMMGNAEHIQLPFNFRMVDESLKTLYYGQGDNNVKADTVYLKKR